VSEQRAFRALFPPLFFLAWAVLFTFPLVTRLGDAVTLARGGDAWLHLWDLWWVDRALVDLHQNPYITNYLLYPTGLNLYYHSLDLFNALLSIPLQHLVGLTAAYNLLMLANLTLDGLAAYWLCFDRTRSVAGSLVGGVLFASAPLLSTSVDLGQLDEVTVWWVPLYILILWRALDAGQASEDQGPSSSRFTQSFPLRASLAAGACLIGASLATWYFTAGLAVFTLIFVPAYLISRRARLAAWVRAALALAVAGGLFVIVLSPLLIAMVRERLSGATYMLPTYYATLFNSADLAGLFLPPRVQSEINQHGSTVSLGYIALALALVGLLRRWRSAWPLGLALLGLVLMALGPQLQFGGNQTGLPLPYSLLNNVPFIGASRQPLRFLATAGACLALLAAFGTAGLMGYVVPRWRAAASVALLALAAVELVVIPRALTPTQVGPTFAFIKSSPTQRAVLEVPNDEWSAASLLHQTYHERPIIGGYTSRHFPYPFGDAAPGVSQLLRADPDPITAPDILTPSVRDTALASLDHYAVRFVVVHKPNMATGRNGRLQQVLDALFTESDRAYDDPDVTIYQTPPRPPGSAPLPLVGLGNGWHKAEQNPLHRWLGSNVTDGNGAVWIGIPNGAEDPYHLKMTAYSYNTPRTLSVLLDGATLHTVQIGTVFQDLDVDLGTLHVGDHQLLLKVAEPPENPPGDERKLSIGVTMIAVERK
jgi:hypothetical protein